MKKINYLLLTIVLTFVFIGRVDALSYTEGAWVQTSDNCGEYAETANGYTSYNFDSATGNFSTAGDSYSTSMSGSGERSYVFYVVSSDQKTLTAYIPSYNSNVGLIDSNLGIPAGSCDTIYKVSKTAIANSTDDTTGGETSDGETGGTTENEGTTGGEASGNENEGTTGDSVTGDQTNNGSTNEEDVKHEDDVPEPENFTPGAGDGTDSTSTSTSGGSLQTTENPSTGISDYILYLIPLFLIVGTILVLKKDKIFVR